LTRPLIDFLAEEFEKENGVDLEKRSTSTSETSRSS